MEIKRVQTPDNSNVELYQITKFVEAEKADGSKVMVKTKPQILKLQEIIQERNRLVERLQTVQSVIDSINQLKQPTEAAEAGQEVI